MKTEKNSHGENATLYSTHILMLPVIFNRSIGDVNRAAAESGWNYRPFRLNEHHENYNEYIYFYEHVRKVLYTKENMASAGAASSCYFETPQQRGTFSFKMADTKDPESREVTETGKTYHLDIVGLSLRTFTTQVGILSIELENHAYGDPEDVLVINDFARRLYPQFLSPKSDKEDGLQEVKGALLPEWVEMKLGQIEEREDFIYYADYSNLEEDITHLPAYVDALFGERFSSRESAAEETIHVEPIIDDRMFLISLYMNDDLSEAMKQYDAPGARYAYETFCAQTQDGEATDPSVCRAGSFWYEFLFVDGRGRTCQSRHLCPKLVRNATYDRWVEWGTLFGMSRYSFVALTGSEYGSKRLEPHMRTLYFQMFTLLLAYRASLLHFSNRVSGLRIRKRRQKGLEQEVQRIYGDYIHFQNNLLFREVTAQEQGIELFAMGYRMMGIDKQVKDLDSEIAELHNYLRMIQDEEENAKLGKLNILAGLLLPVSVLSGIAGMNILPPSWETWGKTHIGWFALGTLAVTGAILWWISEEKNQ